MSEFIRRLRRAFQDPEPGKKRCSECDTDHPQEEMVFHPDTSGHPEDGSFWLCKKCDEEDKKSS